MTNPPFCDCCATPGQWVAEHIDPAALCTNIEEVLSAIAELAPTIRLSDARRAAEQYLRDWQAALSE